MSKILVVSEVRDNELRNISLEAIAAAKQWNNQATIVAVVFGSNYEGHAPKLINFGAQQVIVAQHEALNNNVTPEAITQALLQIIQNEQPEGIVIGHTALGKDVAPRLAARLQYGLVSDVIKIEQLDGETQFVRPIYSGKAFEKRITKTEKAIISIRGNNIEPLAENPSNTGDVVTQSVEVKNLQTIVKEIVRKTTTGIDLSEAKVVVSGGRGLKSAESFNLLQQLADELGGAVGASRGACDAGYCDYALQIGQTGKVVTPDLYIAVGISGAIQHVAGMSNSKVIIAINKDQKQIFSQSQTTGL